MIDHLSVGVKDLDRAAAFYDAALGALGYVRLSANPRHVAYGPPGYTGEPPFAILPHADAASEPRFHIAFTAATREAVDRFHAAAMANGGVDEGPPGIRLNYNPGYYAAFVFDPDGHRVEAVRHEQPAGLPP